ncbi:hypothetical protein DV454_000388 [Geotrichum candidum]|nr:hypothetical protein DV454_000388 [Geotrichum candidum]
MPPNNSNSHSLQPRSQSPEQQRVPLSPQPVARTSKFSWVRRLVARRNGAPIPGTSDGGDGSASNSGASGARKTSNTLRTTSPSAAFQDPAQNSQEGSQHTHFAANSTTRAAHPSQPQNITAASTTTATSGPTVMVDDQSSSHSSFKGRSNSNFTVPSISRTSITTLDTAPSQHGAVILGNTATSPMQGPTLLGPAGDNASIVTLASSSKHWRRRSFDTNASTRGIAPESIRSRRGSLESLPLTTATIRSVPRFQALDMDNDSDAVTDDEGDDGGRTHQTGGADSRSEVLSVNTDHKVAIPSASA